MKLIELTRKTNSKTEQLEIIITILCAAYGKYITKSEAHALSYYVVYGCKKKTDEILITGNKWSKGNIKNIKINLKRKGFLKRSGDLHNSYEVALSKDFSISENEVELRIKLDNA